MDSPYEHKTFADSVGVTFPSLSDLGVKFDFFRRRAMRRIIAGLLICLFGCGGGSFRGTFGIGNTVFSVTGFVGFIELTTVPNTTIPVTIVTFLPDFIPVTTVIFCGDLTQQLFLDDFATVNFTQGPNCATALAIFVDCCGG
jgi:hypothetical protein